MKVAIALPSPAFDVPGGHLTQVRQTARALEARGIAVDLVTEEDLEPASYSLVHGIGLRSETVRLARSQRTPIVLSTIWWSAKYRFGLRGARSPLAVARFAKSRARVGVRAAAGAWSALPDADIRLAFESSDVLLPNSAAEATCIRDELGVTTPCQTVPNAVDTSVFVPDPNVPREDFVLVVGRLDPHKNQLGTVKALRVAERPIIVIGAAHPDHPEYASKCRAALRPGDVLIDRNLGPEELLGYYLRARVHVLASWFETTGLVSLEAAATGAGIVSTDRGFAKEYLGEQARYCHPGRARTIREAVDGAACEPDPELGRRVLRSFTWERAAQRTETAYRVALGDLPSSALSSALEDG